MCFPRNLQYKLPIAFSYRKHSKKRPNDKYFQNLVMKAKLHDKLQNVLQGDVRILRLNIESGDEYYDSTPFFGKTK